MELNLHNYSPNHNQIQSKQSKIQNSVNTTDTLSPFLQVTEFKMCASSFSLHNQTNYNEQREIFAKYLASDSQRHQKQAFIKMGQFYMDKIFSDRVLVDFTNLRKNEDDLNGKILDHFIGIWLLHMGYRAHHNRNHFLARIRLHLGSRALPYFGKMYDKLQFEGIPKSQKLALLLQTCKNGWEYFANECLSLTHRQCKNITRVGRELVHQSRHRRYFSHQIDANWQM